MKLLLLRHGKTYGNLHKRYIGSTDEPLCDMGKNELKKTAIIIKSIETYHVDIQNACTNHQRSIFLSPMKRCIESCNIIFPNSTNKIVEDFRECDFGIFENKNYLELSDSPEYKVWIKSNGKLPFPSGESKENFIKRTCNAYSQILPSFSTYNVILAHGGTIMSLLSEFSNNEKDYYEWSVENACGYLCECDDKCNIEVLEDIILD